MPAQLLSIHPDNPQPNKIAQVSEILSRGGVIIYPTDTVYAIGCDIMHPKAIDKICRLKNIDPAKHSFSIFCKDISHVASYTKPLSNEVFRLMKNNLPGPHTFILQSGSHLPKSLHSKKKTIGIRVSAHAIIDALVQRMEHPLLTTSLKHYDEIVEYISDPEEIFELFKNHVDLIINGGTGGNTPSTVWDCTQEPIQILREGKGSL